MMTEESAFNTLQLHHSATAEEIMARYQSLKDEYRKIKDSTDDLKTQLACQLKEIELDDIFLFLRRKQKI